MKLMEQLPSESIDMVATDPPYSSGGAFRGDRMKSTDDKYTQSEFQGRRPDFMGDNRDQRAFLAWSTIWFGEMLRMSTADGRLVAFIDWRQLPTLTDAVQCGGWIWRGIVPWNEGEGTRPTPGGFRNQCEYVVWCSKGPLPTGAEGVLVLPGFIQVTVKQDDKFHQTGKPTELMRQLVKVCRPGGLVFDPFAGSGTTGVAALMEGRRVILCERVPEYAEISRRRCEAVEQGIDWRKPEQPSLFGSADGSGGEP